MISVRHITALFGASALAASLSLSAASSGSAGDTGSGSAVDTNSGWTRSVTPTPDARTASEPDRTNRTRGD
ncbi:hypothetical protein [Chitinolyticbacter meiyuanensis]|uniref:hypothetical protein n=1 Tax=Chitinolyticbacter meiyuanensis TaxID=682798 RepID=UPI0011E5E6E4|nr:hypothetical protein [Chitinolyticbacter meiyuanensis]